MQRFARTLTLTAACSLSATTAAAVTIVDWGGNYVSSTQNTQLSLQDSGPVDLNGDTVDDSRRHYGYSDTSDANPAIGANYNGSSASFHGGTETIKFGLTTNGGFVNLRVIDGSNPAADAIQITGGVSSSQGQTGLTSSSVLLWDEFMGIGAGEQVIYDDLTSMLVKYGEGGVSGSNRTRFLLRDADGNYYVSNSSFTGGNGGFGVNLNNFAAETWAAYDPNRTLNGETGVMSPEPFSFASLAGNTVVDGVGLFMHYTPSGVSGTVDLKVTDFTVQANPSQVPPPPTPAAPAVPEPASMALIALAGTALLARRRRDQA